MLQISSEPFDSPEARAMSRAYYEELTARFPGGFLPDACFSASAADFVSPNGRFLIARIEAEPAGCGGLRRFDDASGEIKHMWVAPQHRGRGIARAVLEELERIATELGYARLLLDTSEHLAEAFRLYSSSGYSEIASYNDNRYAQHWFEKVL